MVSGEKVNAELVQSIPLDLLRESIWNPRRRYLQEAMEELTESIRAGGIRVPLIVRPVNGNAYQIGAGHRRSRAARAAGLAEVPCIVREMTDPEFLELLALENIQREDLTELEEAAGYRELLDRAGYDVKKIAAATGKNLAHIYARLKLLDLVDEPKQALADGKISAGHAILIARLQPKDQVAAIKEIMSWPEWRGRMSVRDLSAWIDREMKIDLARAPFPISDAKLLPQAGACPGCTKRTKAQPDVYPDAQAPDAADECLDRECYKDKVAAHRQLALALHPEAVKISTDFRSKGKGVYAHGEYDLVVAAPAKDQVGLKDAVFMDGPRVGQVVKVRLRPLSKPAAQSAGIPASKSEKERQSERKRRVAENEARQQARTEILAAIAPKVKGTLLRSDLFLIASAIDAWLGGPLATTDLGKMSDKELGKYIVNQALQQFDQATIYDEQELPLALVDAASRYGVDAVAIEKKALAALDPPAAPAAAATKDTPAPKKAAKPAGKKTAAAKPAKKAKAKK